MIVTGTRKIVMLSDKSNSSTMNMV